MVNDEFSKHEQEKKTKRGYTFTQNRLICCVNVNGTCLKWALIKHTHRLNPCRLHAQWELHKWSTQHTRTNRRAVDNACAEHVAWIVLVVGSTSISRYSLSPTPSDAAPSPPASSLHGWLMTQSSRCNNPPLFVHSKLSKGHTAPWIAPLVIDLWVAVEASQQYSHRVVGVLRVTQLNAEYTCVLLVLFFR